MNLKKKNEKGKQRQQGNSFFYHTMLFSTLFRCIFQYPCYHDYFIIVLFFNSSFSSFISIHILCTIVHHHGNKRKQNTCKQTKIFYSRYIWCRRVSNMYNSFSICTDHLNVLLPLKDFIPAFYWPLYQQNHFSNDFTASCQARNIKLFLNVFPHEKSCCWTSLP